jgi:hypothetical protein
LLALLASACQPSPTPIVLPTAAQFATAEASPTSEPTIDTTAASTEVMETMTLTSTPSATPTITRTPSPMPTQPSQPTTTPDTIASATAAAQEAPRFATITPAPANATVEPTTTPVIVADVVITEAQFQEELDPRLAAYPNIQSATLNFTPDGVKVTLTASGGDALITGEITILFQVDNGLVYISVGEVQLNAVQIPDAYTTAINNLYQVVLDSMDAILRQRLGDATDLENVFFTDTTMNLTLLVPISIATNAP